jgi:hypothetical protein
LIGRFKIWRVNLSHLFPGFVHHPKRWFYKRIWDIVIACFSNLLRSFINFLRWKWNIFPPRRYNSWQRTDI